MRAGLQKRVGEAHVWKHRGKVLWNGAFAVAKDATEDRFISALVPLNHLLDPTKVPRPCFAYVPKMRSMRTERHVRAHQEVTMPRGQQWRSAARPGGHAHITIEEAKAALRGIWVCLEHPADPGTEPYCSIFATPGWQNFRRLRQRA